MNVGPLKLMFYELRKTMALSELIEVEESQEREWPKGFISRAGGWGKRSNIESG
jgi:hypothetical protein